MRRALWLALPCVLFTAPGCYLHHERPLETDGGAPVEEPPPRCDAMDVRTVPLCTIGVPTYWWWNGSQCTSSICACGGEDCGGTFGSEDACTRAFARCE